MTDFWLLGDDDLDGKTPLDFGSETFPTFEAAALEAHRRADRDDSIIGLWLKDGQYTLCEFPPECIEPDPSTVGWTLDIIIDKDEPTPADAPTERAANREWFVRCACSPGVIAYCGPEPVTCPRCQNTEIDTWPQAAGHPLYIIDDDDAESFDRAQLIAANGHDIAMIALLDALQVGEEQTYGGGAAATFTIRRVQ